MTINASFILCAFACVCVANVAAQLRFRIGDEICRVGPISGFLQKGTPRCPPGIENDPNAVPVLPSIRPSPAPIGQVISLGNSVFEVDGRRCFVGVLPPVGVPNAANLPRCRPGTEEFPNIQVAPSQFAAPEIVSFGNDVFSLNGQMCRLNINADPRLPFCTFTLAQLQDLNVVTAPSASGSMPVAAPSAAPRAPSAAPRPRRQTRATRDRRTRRGRRARRDTRGRRFN